MKNKLTLISLVTVVFVFLFAGIIITPYTQTQNKTVLKENSNDDYQNIPIVDFDESRNALNSEKLSTNETQVRLKKNGKYNNLNVVWELPSNILKVKPRSAHWALEVPAIPIEQSDLIIIGTVKTSQAFLSGDKTGVYSEFSVYIEKVLKSKSLIQEGEQLSVTRLGGAVRFPSGKIQRIEVFKGQEFPKLHEKYIFFLRKSDIPNDFSILTAYELHENEVKPLDSIAPYTDYKGAKLTTFLDKIRDEIDKNNLQKKGEN